MRFHIQFFMLLVILFTFTMVACAQNRRLGQRAGLATGESVTFGHKGIDREYRVFVPRSYDQDVSAPLVICLHGGGGNSAQGSKMGLSPVATRNGFIAVYPNAIDKHWNDGRNAERFEEHDSTISDVDFIVEVVTRIKAEYNVDNQRVFVTGPSNGGFMSQRLVMERPDLFSAAAVVIASMGQAIQKDFQPDMPVSILFMNGTEDPLVPYKGGIIAEGITPRLDKLRGFERAGRGRCIPTDKAVAMWVERNGIESQPVVTQIEDANKNDETTVELSLWKGGQRDTVVALYKVIGGGHTIPGSRQYLPEKVVGKTNMDIRGFEVIWDFFSNHPRKPSVE